MKQRLSLIIVSVFIVMSLLLGACTKVAPTTAPEVTEAATDALVATVVATEAPAAEPVTIKYWHTMSDPESAKLEEVIATFETANPGITVEATRYAWSDLKTALLTAIAGGDVPDTVRMDIAWVSEFAAQGALMQLDGNLADFDAIAASVFPGPLATNKWDGHYYGLPQNTNTQVLVYDTAAFETAGITTPPATIEEFVTDACALTDTTKGTYGYAQGGTYFWAPAPLFYAMGGKIVDEGITTATGYVNSAESVAAFTMMKDLYDRGCMSPNLLGGGIATDAGQGTGIYAMIIDGPWMVDIYKANFPELKYAFAPIPAGATGTSSVVGGEDVVILDGSQNKESAAKWVAYLMSEETQIALAQVGVVPTLSSLTGSADLPEYFGIFMEQLKTAQARVPSPKWSDMDTAVNNAYQRILNGDQTPQEALDQAATEIDALLAN